MTSAAFADLEVDNASLDGKVSGTAINIQDAPEGKNVDGSTGASIMITDASAGRVIVDMSTYKPAEHKNTAKVVIVGQRSDFGLNSWAGHSGTAIGAGAQAAANNSTAIGAGSLAIEENSISFGNSSTGTYYKLTNVADGTVSADSHDIVSGGQLYTEQVTREKNEAILQSQVTNLNTNVKDLGKEIDSVGAVSAAIAGLHPLDYDGTGSKFQLSAAAGTYDGKQAVALGGFYHANPDVLISLAASTDFGEHKTAANLGATFRIGEGSSVPASQNSEILSKVNALVDDVATLKEENETLKAQLAAMQAK